MTGQPLSGGRLDRKTTSEQELSRCKKYTRYRRPGQDVVVDRFCDW